MTYGEFRKLRAAVRASLAESNAEERTELTKASLPEEPVKQGCVRSSWWKRVTRGSGTCEQWLRICSWASGSLVVHGHFLSVTAVNHGNRLCLE